MTAGLVRIPQGYREQTGAGGLWVRSDAEAAGRWELKEYGGVDMETAAAVILAAGMGTRMKSEYPKVLHEVNGMPMIGQVLRVVREAGCGTCVTVVGYKGDLVRQAMGDRTEYVEQKEQLGTGHAVMQAAPYLKGHRGYVLVICGDTPLLRSETIRRLISECREKRAAAAVLTAVLDNPYGYGRVIRDEQGRMTHIVEQKDGTAEELAVREINTGTYCFDIEALLDTLPKLTCQNAQGEYYLTDVFGMMIQEGRLVWPVAAEDAEETMGVNSRIQLAAADKVLRMRKAAELMDAGVTIIDPERVYIGQDVTVGRDTVLWPGVILSGQTSVGCGCRIGPDTELSNVTCGDGNRLNRVYAHDCVLGNHNEIGPFVHLRPGTVLKDNIKIGNFVEVKNSNVGNGTKLPHLIYCGDADVGEKVNFGCGTVTVNFDGKEKHRTVVGDHAFIGCNTNLVAPVEIGARAFTAAGSTITKDVPKEALAVARARQKNIEHWVKENTYKD